MIVFRLICGVLVAWAINWALGRLLNDVPDMKYIGPIAGGLVGFLNLAKRQGWGVIVSVANGMWTGLLTILVSGFIYLTMRMMDALFHNLIKDFENFLRILGQEAKPLIESAVNLELIGITVAATAVTGIVSECLHWSLVKLRKYREGEEADEPA
jgi:hypothetical protein